MRGRINTMLAVATGARVRHYGGFVLAGLLAFAVDAVMLEALMHGAGLSPYLARPVGISLAMVVSWLVNRSVTFAMRSRPTVAEFAKVAAVSWSAQAINYGVFALVLLLWPRMLPFAALVISSFVAMFFSYGGFRFAVFGKGLGATPRRPAAGD
jgi:putative flippase GtrA